MIDDGRSAIVVDPGEAGPVRAALDAKGLALPGILVRPRGLASVAVGRAPCAVARSGLAAMRTWKNAFR
jgi:hypothetical protein